MIFSQRKIRYGLLETATSGGTLTLDVDSKELQILTGTLNHTIVLPNATTLVNGIAFKIINNSTGTITINRNGGGLLTTLDPSQTVFVLLTDNSSAAGEWFQKTGTTGTGTGLAYLINSSTINVNYSILLSDNGKVLKVDTSSAITVTLPAPTAGFKVTIKDITGNASVNNITIARNGAEDIDGVAANISITENNQGVSLISDGTDWSRLDKVSTRHVNRTGKGLFGGGNTGAVSDVIDKVRISVPGNATDFGDLTVARRTLSACSSSTIALWAGGNTGAVSDVIDYVNMATDADTVDFGNLTIARTGLAGCSNQTRGLFAGGFNGTQLNTIDYITIASAGNATDFGDLTVAREDVAACSSSTRGIFAGGTTGAVQNTIDYITIASAGNATDFGDLTTVRYAAAGCSSKTKGLFGGGIQTPVTPVNNIDYITISILSNATNFGNLTIARYYAGACSSSVRGLFAGGNDGAISNVIDRVTIALEDNAVDFGDLSVARDQLAACSSSHGGLYV